MDRIANDFAVAAVYMQKAGFDGILVHGGHGFIFTQYLSPLMNTRTDEYGGSLENRAKFPIQICKAIREAVGPDFLFELRIDGTDHQPGGITPEETGEFIQMVEQYITSVHVTCGIYEESVKSGTESSMFHEHGLNIEPASIIEKIYFSAGWSCWRYQLSGAGRSGNRRWQDRLCNFRTSDAGRSGFYTEMYGWRRGTDPPLLKMLLNVSRDLRRKVMMIFRLPVSSLQFT